jgi:agarase
VDQHDGVFWLVDPGGRFLSKGVNNVAPSDHVRNTARPHADACRKNTAVSVWRAAVDRQRWHFIRWAAGRMNLRWRRASPLAIAPAMNSGLPSLHRRDTFPDVFDPAFAAHIRERASTHCARRCHDVRLLGTFIDNEMYWSPDWRGADELLTVFLNLPSHRPGRVGHRGCRSIIANSRSSMRFRRRRDHGRSSRRWTVEAPLPNAPEAE